MCLSQASICIYPTPYNVAIYCVYWFEDWSGCWYWWKCWPSLCTLFLYKTWQWYFWANYFEWSCPCILVPDELFVSCLFQYLSITLLQRVTIVLIKLDMQMSTFWYNYWLLANSLDRKSSWNVIFCNIRWFI